MSASFNGHVEVVRILIGSKAQLNKQKLNKQKVLVVQ